LNSVSQQEQKANGIQAELGRALGALTEVQSLASNSVEIVEAENIVKSVLNRALEMNTAGIGELRAIIAERSRSIEPLEAAAASLERIQTSLDFLNAEEGKIEIDKRMKERDRLAEFHTNAQQQLETADEPTLSMVATRRSAERRSGAKVPKACHAPLNSSSSAMRFRISGVIWRTFARIITPNNTPIYTHLWHPQTYTIKPVCGRGISSFNSQSVIQYSFYLNMKWICSNIN
jgi:hypothetical protein